MSRLFLVVIVMALISLWSCTKEEEILIKEIDDHIQNFKERIDRVIEIGLENKIKEVS